MQEYFASHNCIGSSQKLTSAYKFMKLILPVLIKEFFIIKYFQVVSFDAEWREVYIGYVRKDLFTGTRYRRKFFIFSVLCDAVAPMVFPNIGNKHHHKNQIFRRMSKQCYRRSQNQCKICHEEQTRKRCDKRRKMVIFGSFPSLITFLTQLGLNFSQL